MIEMSFSQANSYKLCPRQWAFSKVDKIKGIPSLAAIRGTRYHDAIEEHIKNGEASNHPFIARALKVVSRLGGGEAEKYVEHIEGEVKVRGYIDLATENTVVDWKFPGKKPTSLKTDYKKQLNLYAFLDDADTVEAYMPEHDVSFSKPADKWLGEEVLESIIETGEKILSSGALGIKGFNQEAKENWSCKEYCEFRGICPNGG